MGINEFKALFIFKKPTMLDYVKPEMSKKAQTIVLASFEKAKRDQDKILKRARKMK